MREASTQSIMYLTEKRGGKGFDIVAFGFDELDEARGHGVWTTFLQLAERGFALRSLRGVGIGELSEKLFE